MATSPKASTSPSKQLIRRFLKAMTKGEPGDLSKYAARNVIGHQGAESTQGIASLEAYAAYYRAAFKGWEHKIDHLIAEGTWVAARGRTTGVIKSVGARFSIPWLAHYRIERGKIVEVRMLADTSVLSKMEQGGVKMGLRH